MKLAVYLKYSSGFATGLIAKKRQCFELRKLNTDSPQRRTCIQLVIYNYAKKNCGVSDIFNVSVYYDADRRKMACVNQNVTLKKNRRLT